LFFGGAQSTACDFIQRPIARRRKTKRMEGSVPGYKQATPPGFSRSVFGSWATGAGKDELFEVGYPSRDA
jgi:hypothetical protein